MTERKQDFNILMVCTEYPPMQGGIGRYTYNLVKSLRSKGIKSMFFLILMEKKAILKDYHLLQEIIRK
jgi:hypothetical protein